jgi:hypothetical protein
MPSPPSLKRGPRASEAASTSSAPRPSTRSASPTGLVARARLAAPLTGRCCLRSLLPPWCGLWWRRCALTEPCASWWCRWRSSPRTGASCSRLRCCHVALRMPTASSVSGTRPASCRGQIPPPQPSSLTSPAISAAWSRPRFGLPPLSSCPGAFARHQRHLCGIAGDDWIVTASARPCWPSGAAVRRRGMQQGRPGGDSMEKDLGSVLSTVFS